MNLMKAMLAAGLRLEEALRQENEALARLDMTRAAALATVKVQASDAFAAATTAAGRAGARPEGEERRAAEGLAGRCATSRRRTGGFWSVRSRCSPASSRRSRGRQSPPRGPRPMAGRGSAPCRGRRRRWRWRRGREGWARRRGAGAASGKWMEAR
ncbi:hypothetical protein ACE7GA_23710 [Roseomonas sp. CCTCC AB2023176]|uniref:hypothetical protein n=1 Tax=Roseomonas sp. CCTCC AB2023176 TaxID=3342640 RepID=UPI0035D99FA8